MRHMTAHRAQEDFERLVDTVTQYNEPVTIVSDNDKAVVLISMEEWRGIQETLYLQSLPGMVESITAASKEPVEDGIPLSEVNFDI